MIPNFKTYIKEGLWAKGVDRSKTGEERIEDHIVSNIKSLKEIDLGLPFLIADNDLTIEDKHLFTYPDLDVYKKHVISSGWRYPIYEELNEYINSDFIKYKQDVQNSREIQLYSEKTKQTLEIAMDAWYGHDYWCVSDIPTKWSINNRINMKRSLFSRGVDENKEMNIRLVKDKHVNEGLWSKGVDRSKTGEKRIEDISVIDEICNFINRALCKKYDIPYEQIVIWKESKKANQEKYYFLMGCKFSDLDDSYPNIQFMVDDLKTKNKDEINHVLLAINNGFIHFRDRDMTKMFGDVKPEYKSIAKIIYFIINDVIEPKMKYVIRNNCFMIDVDKVDVKSLLDINKDVKY